MNEKINLMKKLNQLKEDLDKKQREIYEGKENMLELCKSNCKKLIGKCFKFRDNYQKILSITGINYYSELEITYNCIRVYKDDKDVNISTNCSGYMQYDRIESCMISEEEFDIILNSAIECIKNKSKSIDNKS